MTGAKKQWITLRRSRHPAVFCGKFNTSIYDLEIKSASMTFSSTLYFSKNSFFFLLKQPLWIKLKNLTWKSKSLTLGYIIFKKIFSFQMIGYCNQYFDVSSFAFHVLINYVILLMFFYNSTMVDYINTGENSTTIHLHFFFIADIYIYMYVDFP